MSLSPAIRRAVISAGVAVLAVGGTALPANAADFVAPSCPGFDVGVTFLTSHGNPIQAGPRAIIAAGSGTSVVDNETTKASVTIQGAGAFRITDNPDGTLTFTATGRSVVLLFDTDPGGPATTLYTGGVTTLLGTDGTLTVVSHQGAATDLCAALGG
ncbi:hypothetical protein JCM18899A_05210 [Nocardioides sp. AN3]